MDLDRNSLHYAFAEYVSHNTYALDYVIALRGLPDDKANAVAQITVLEVEKRIAFAMGKLRRALDTEMIDSYHLREYGPGQHSPTTEYLAGLLPPDKVSGTSVCELLMRANLSEDKYYLWCLKKTFDINAVQMDIGEAGLTWKRTGDVETPWIAESRRGVFEARLCLFPMEPVYSIANEGRHVIYVNDWPTEWPRLNRLAEGCTLSPRRVSVLRRLGSEYASGEWRDQHPLGSIPKL